MRLTSSSVHDVAWEECMINKIKSYEMLSCKEQKSMKQRIEKIGAI